MYSVQTFCQPVQSQCSVLHVCQCVHPSIPPSISLAVQGWGGGQNSARVFSTGEIPYFKRRIFHTFFQCRCGIFPVWTNKTPAAITSHMVKSNSLTIQTLEELLLAALLCCVFFADCNPRILFLPMHSRFRRCGISPLTFWDRCGIFPVQNFRLRKNPGPLYVCMYGWHLQCICQGARVLGGLWEASGVPRHILRVGKNSKTLVESI